MKNLKSISRQVCLFLGVISLMAWTSTTPEALNDLKPLGDFVSNNQLNVEIESLGGHRQECVELTIKNVSSKTIKTYLEPGRRFVSDDIMEQDIFIVKKKEITIPPLATIKVKGYGFCCQSFKHSPQKGSSFGFGYMAPDEWIQLADTINDNNFDASAVQSAVWSLSDGHDIASIHSENRDAVLPLLRTVASIRNIHLPWYSFSYVPDSTRLFSNKPEKLHGSFDYYLKNNAAVSIVVKNEKGRLMKHLVKGHVYGHGKQTFSADIKVENWPKGNYEIIVVEDFWNINSVKRFSL
mgnify:CR=1 FL=1